MAFPRPAHDDASGLELVTARATLDREFRRALLTRPREAIAQTFGVELPARLRLKFIEKDPSYDLVVVLPDLIDDGALSEADLERTSGGADLWGWLGTVAAIAAAAD